MLSTTIILKLVQPQKYFFHKEIFLGNLVRDLQKASDL